MNIIRVTPMGEQHGKINQWHNSSKELSKGMSSETKSKLEKEKEEDARIVKARYINHRGEHERLTKPYCRYAGDPIEYWHLIPNEVYELPIGFIKEVNESPGLAQRSKMDVHGQPVIDSKPFKLHELFPISF
jgi:hypothetical protein